MAYLLAHMIKLMDSSTEKHIKRTSGYVKLLIEAMIEKSVYINEFIGLDINAVISSSRLHDIGKIAIPNGLLIKPGKLTSDEYGIVKTHAKQGAKIIQLLGEIFGDNEFLQHAIHFSESHHEKWDGTGYPKGLAEFDIPLHGRIMAVADVYDALTSARPYKKAMTHEEAIAIINDERGKHFDPNIADIFVMMQDELQRYLKRK
jgi:putative two-component system response regulator